MIDFSQFDTNRFSKLLLSLKNYTDNNLRYPKVGELVEKALESYSNGFLKRVNLPGVDLVGIDGKTYESKVTQFKNKSQMSVRGLIIKNRRQAGVNPEDKLADYFIITDVKKGKACCIKSSNLYNLVCNGATLTGSADPNLTNFFLTGFNFLEGNKKVKDYFNESDTFDKLFIQSI